jgi:glutamine amidotransferase
VDYSLGNLFSVKHACEHVGMQATITNDRQTILQADAVLLPGVGAFGDAMETLSDLDLITVLQDIAVSPKPLVGICLGIQLLMTESFEFGRHRGLGIIEGTVVRFDNPREGPQTLKVPEICWNRITQRGPWEGTLLDGVPNEAHMYFVHSYIAQPQDPAVVLSTTRYGDVEFCSSLRKGTVFACQFHPERSGTVGLKMYQNLAAQLRSML